MCDQVMKHFQWSIFEIVQNATSQLIIGLYNTSQGPNRDFLACIVILLPLTFVELENDIIKIVFFPHAIF